MEDNEKKNDDMTEIVEQKVESTNDTTNNEIQSNSSIENDISPEANTKSPISMVTNHDQSDVQSTEAKGQDGSKNNIDQSQVPSSSTETIGQCSDECTQQKIIENCTTVNSPNESTILTITANTSNESVLTNINELNNDDDDLASSSRLVEKESDCRTTQNTFNNKPDKSEIINELTTTNVTNCDSSEIIDDSINGTHSNGSNNVSDSVEIVVADTNENGGANNCADNEKEMHSNKDAENKSKVETYKSQSTTPFIPCAISSSSVVDSTENNEIENDEMNIKINEEPSSSVETSEEKIHSEDDNTPSVHSIINDKGGGTENKNTLLLSTQQQSDMHEIVLNKSLDSINSSLVTDVHTMDDPVETNDSKDVRLDKSSETEICSTSRTEDKSGCDQIHSSIVENPVAYCGSVIKPTNLIVTHIKGNDEAIQDTDRSSTIIHSESLSHIELPKSTMDGTIASSINLTTESKAKITSIANASSSSLNEPPSANTLSLDLTQPTAMSRRQNSMYVSNPDFSRHKATTKDLSPLRMKPPDFSKLTNAYSTNHLKIPNPNFKEMDALPPKQPTVNPANFAEISKRFNYISDLQLKNATPQLTPQLTPQHAPQHAPQHTPQHTPQLTPQHNNLFERTIESHRNLSNLYVKAPDFSVQKKSTSHDLPDEPTAHVIHKNPYLNQADKSNKNLPSDPSIIYRSYPQLSQDVTMSIVPTHNAPYNQPHQQPLSQRQNFVEQPQTSDQRYKQNYPGEVHKLHHDLYRASLPNPQHPYENRISDASYTSQSKAMNIPYKPKADQANTANMYQRENTRAAVIQSGKPGIDSENYNHKMQPNYGPRNEIPAGYYEKPSPKPVATNQHSDYMQCQPPLSNTRYPSDFGDRIPSNKSNYDRPGYSDQPMPSLYQEHYKQTHLAKSANLSSNTNMAAPSNHPLRSPIMHSKPIDVPIGHMNPPQHWPSHSPRITQSPISLSSSPLSGRVTQSPAGASPSPQHHIIHTPSAMSAQSPTYRYTSPHQTSTPSPYNIATTSSSPIQFKDIVNPAMFQKPPKSKSSKPTKTTASQPINSNYYHLPLESAPYPGHQYSMKVEQSTHYPPHQYSAKTDNNARDDPRSKQTKNKTFNDYVDLTKTSKPSETPSSQIQNMIGPENRYDRYDPRYLNERHEFHQNHRQETMPNKPEIRGNDKHMYNSQQKTIMDPYAYRQASEADLNYEIIKKTLNKDISIRRSDADLSCSIFDNPKLNQSKNSLYSASNEQYYPRVSTYQPNFNYHQAPAESSVRRDSKGVQISDPNRYYPAPPHPPAKGSNPELENASRARSYSVESNARTPSELKKHDLSVTVSRISAAIAQPVERARMQHSETTIPITHQPSAARNQQSTSQPTRAKTDLQQTSVTLPQKPSSTMKSVLTPVKRESPLDLSVKTVKTKADSTGDDYVVPSSSRDYNAPLSLKVEFAPNFQKHSRVSDKNTTNEPQLRYENQIPTNSQYPGIQRQPHQIPERNQNIPQRSADKLLDVRYHNQNTHPPHGSTTYLHSQSQMTAASTQNRPSQIPNEPFKHQSKPMVLSPAVPTVFGRKPEDLKNLPINPEIQEFKSTTNPMQIGSYENVQGRSKSQSVKANYHSKVPEPLLNSHHPNRQQEVPVKYPDFKTNIDVAHVKTIQQTPVPPLIESPYGLRPNERSDKYQNMNNSYPAYPEQRSSHPRSQSNNSVRSIEEMASGHFDPYYSRKRPAEQPSHDQYPKAKQMRRDEPIQQAHYYNMDKTRYSIADPKKPERYVPVEKVEYNQKYVGNSYQRQQVETKYPSLERIPPIHTEPRDTMNPVTAPIRENVPPDYNKQLQYHHYPEQMYNTPVDRPPTHTPVISYPTEQHQKHLAYQKSKKEVYKQLPSPPPNQQLPSHNYYPRDMKNYPHQNYNVNSYQPSKPEVKTYFNEPNYASIPNQQHHLKQDSNPPQQQPYQEQWPQNQQTLQPDSSKPYYPSNESATRNYKDYNPTHPSQASSDLVVRPAHRSNPIEGSSRQSTALKGADQNVISKLRTNLEMKEIEKQKMLRNQSSTETVEDENQKSDIASLIAARIRTKGELKGFTPIPIAEPKPVVIEAVRCDDDRDKSFPQSNSIRDSCSDADNTSALDLLDWGSACNDFVEQLQGGTGVKKRGGRRRRAKSSLIDMEFETVGQEIPLKNLPGIDYKCDIDEDLVNIVKAENKSHQPLDESLNKTTKNDETSSSDEDKPLLFLRQKSLSEMGKLKTVNDEDTESAPKEALTNEKTERTAVLAKLSDKIAKNKKGQQREKRENEKRISIATSSESDDEISSKLNKRPKKTVRKPRTRSSVGYKNTTDDETSDNGSKNSKRKNDHTKRKKSVKSSSDSEPIKQRKKVPKIESDESEEDTNATPIVELIHIKQEVISDDDESDSKTDLAKSSEKKGSESTINVKIEETMTRSKRKQELERQKANSKILRNDKMVKNVSITERKTLESKKPIEKNSPKKCKASGSKDDMKRKDDCDNGESSKNGSPKKKGIRIASVQSISSDTEESEVEVSLRLRTRSAKSMDQRTPEKPKAVVEKVVEKKWLRNTSQKKNAKETIIKPPIEQFPPGWENEVYEFKRSLKIPASLITIKRPAWYRKSISLPDLDTHSSDTSDTFSEKKQIFLKPLSELSDRRTPKKDSKRGRPPNSTNTTEKVTLKVTLEVPQKTTDDLRSKSIIDLLHQKIIHPMSKHNKKARLLPSNEPKILPQTTEIELLPTPGAENVFKHQSVFETAVIKSRTRKEYRVQKNQEIIREVFGCDDRPASAPPLNAIVDGSKTTAVAITFDQKYKQYLEKMNMDFGDNKSKFEIKPDVSIVKQEKIDEDSLLNQDDETQDTEINDCERNALDIKEEPLDSNERDTPSVSEREGITPSSFSLIRKRGRGTRGGRRKGSSGFDYIRKKKKPLPQLIGTEGAPLHQKRRAAAINYLQEKDENDINREIRGWVLNKGVGETVLHKAARLGYIDVIAFCLERLEMNPDQKDNAGYTALHEACNGGQLDIARLLLQYGANHSETAVLGGIRPLHEAVENGCIEIVRLLLSYGADPLLATYSGQTPIMLAENDDQMAAFLKNYLHDIQNTGPNKMPWRFEGAWKSYGTDDHGYDIFDEIPSDDIEIKSNKPSILPTTEPIATNQVKSNLDDANQIKINKCDSNSNIMLLKNAHKRPNTLPSSDNHRSIKSKYKNLSPCTVVLTNLTEKNNVKPNGSSKPTLPSLSNVNQMSDITAEPPEIIEFSDDESDAEFFEIEESQAPHVPLYHLRDEGAVKWALLSDLCYMLKVKSKDTLLKQICPSSPPSSGNNKELLRELKMCDFLERATCLQLLCAGEKLNIRSSKVVLVKYNESVKNLLGVKTLLMKM